MSNEPPLILETDNPAAPPAVQASVLKQLEILATSESPRERAHLARWWALQARIADYRLRHPAGPHGTVWTPTYDMPLSPRPQVTSPKTSVI